MQSEPAAPSSPREEPSNLDSNDARFLRFGGPLPHSLRRFSLDLDHVLERMPRGACQAAIQLWALVTLAGSADCHLD